MSLLRLMKSIIVFSFSLLGHHTNFQYLSHMNQEEASFYSMKDEIPINLLGGRNCFVEMGSFNKLLYMLLVFL